MAGSTRPTAPPKRSGANGWKAVWPPRCPSGRLIRIRFIGIADGHREIVRVDRSGPNGAVRIVPQAELKQVGDAPYFRELDQSAADEVYVSPVDLNEANGVIEMPHVPTMRIAKPVLTPERQAVRNRHRQRRHAASLERVRASVRPDENVYVVDARGNYLVHPDRAREFGAQLGGTTDWQRTFPIWRRRSVQRKASHVSCQIEPGGPAVGDGACRPGRQANGSQSSRRFPMLPSWLRRRRSRAASIAVGLIAVLCAAVLALLVARSLTRPIVRLTKAVQGTGRNGTAAIPVDAPVKPACLRAHLPM